VNRLEVWIDDESLGGSAFVGHLSKTASRTGETISFEYDPSWLASTGPVVGFPLDELYFGAGQQYARAGANELSGAFQDCSPDRWGKRLMDRREAIEAREERRKARNLRAWDYLVGVNDESRMGALRLVDPESARYVDDRTLSAPPITELRQAMPTYPTRWSAGSSRSWRPALHSAAPDQKPVSVTKLDSCGLPSSRPMMTVSTWDCGSF
jgi:serine/threonine-protein kinase HipA